MITDADRDNPRSLTLEPRESSMTSKVAPTAGSPAFLPPASQPTEPIKRPTLSLPQAAHRARDKVKARV